MNSLVQAYLGDAVYELYIREHLVKSGIAKINNLQKEAIKLVCAKSQANFVRKMLENNFLTSDEIDVFYRARNHKGNHRSKSTDIITYKHATGLEAVIGYLSLEKKHDRINEIINFILNESR